jgi:hypothetical protein
MKQPTARGNVSALLLEILAGDPAGARIDGLPEAVEGALAESGDIFFDDDLQLAFSACTSFITPASTAPVTAGSGTPG